MSNSFLPTSWQVFASTNWGSNWVLYQDRKQEAIVKHKTSTSGRLN